MKTGFLATMVGLCLALTPAVAAEAPGTITFVAQNKVATADGIFHKWRIVEAIVDEANPSASRIVLEIDLKSIDTGNTKRDNHLRDPDFFDVEKYPTASVVIDNVRYEGGDVFDADVALDLHGKQKTMPIRFRIEDREERKITAAFTLNRMDFEVGSPYSMINPFSIEEDIPMKVTALIPPAVKSEAP